MYFHVPCPHSTSKTYIYIYIYTHTHTLHSNHQLNHRSIMATNLLCMVVLLNGTRTLRIEHEQTKRCTKLIERTCTKRIKVRFLCSEWAWKDMKQHWRIRWLLAVAWSYFHGMRRDRVCRGSWCGSTFLLANWIVLFTHHPCI